MVLRFVAVAVEQHRDALVSVRVQAVYLPLPERRRFFRDGICGSHLRRGRLFFIRFTRLLELDLLSVHLQDMNSASISPELGKHVLKSE